MKIVIFRRNAEWTTARFFVEAFVKLGHEVREVFFDDKTDVVYDDVPDADFYYIHDGSHCFPIFAALSTRNEPKAIYLIDDCHNKGKYSEWMRKFSKYGIVFDFVFRAQKYCCLENDLWLPLAFSPEYHSSTLDKSAPFPNVIGFIGASYGVREEISNEFKKQFGSKVDFYFKWDIWGTLMANRIGHSKIGFNKSYDGDLNQRFFELLGNGRAVCLTDSISVESGINDIADVGEHYYSYSSIGEAIEIAQMILANEGKRKKMVDNAFSLANSRHTYIERAKKILEKINA